VIGWLLISVSLPRLPAALTSVLLLVQPIGSVALGVVILDEHPSMLQLLGVVVILGGVLLATLKVPVRAAAPLALDAEVSSH
jgi:drug/metabolite transporter (DMT)-like permease